MSATVTLTAVATFEVPIEVLAEAVGAEIESARLRSMRRKVGLRAATKELFLAVEGVVAALNKLEISTNTPGERAARDHLMSAVSELRKAQMKHRIKEHGNRI